MTLFIFTMVFGSLLAMAVSNGASISTIAFIAGAYALIVVVTIFLKRIDNRSKKTDNGRKDQNNPSRPFGEGRPQ